MIKWPLPYDRSLRSKRFRRVFRSSRSIFRFLNAGKLGRAQKIAPSRSLPSTLPSVFRSPQFLRRQKAKKYLAEKTYGNACYAGYYDRPVTTDFFVADTKAQKFSYQKTSLITTTLETPTIVFFINLTKSSLSWDLDLPRQKPGGRQMPDPRAVPNLLMPHPRD